jgi:hypothetical protein
MMWNIDDIVMALGSYEQTEKLSQIAQA